MANRSSAFGIASRQQSAPQGACRSTFLRTQCRPPNYVIVTGPVVRTSVSPAGVTYSEQVNYELGRTLVD